MITPLVGSTLTPSLDGVRLHVEPVFVATTVEFPTVTSTRSASALGVTVTRAFASSLATVGAAGVAALPGRATLAAVLASLFPCLAVALTCVPALAALCATVTTPLVGSTLTPVFVGDKVHVEPVFVATTVEFPTVTSTRSASVLGVTVTRAFAVSLTTVGAPGVAVLGALGITTASLISDVVSLVVKVFPYASLGGMPPCAIFLTVIRSFSLSALVGVHVACPFVAFTTVCFCPLR